MAVYYINLALILVAGYILTVWKPSKLNTIIYLIITFGFMWVLATFRKDIGYDYTSYIRTFEAIKSLSFPELVSSFGNSAAYQFVPKEGGFSLLTWIMSRFISSYVVMYGVYNLIIFVPVMRFIYKYCSTPWLSVWMYVTLVFFYTNMNFIRQSVACSITLLAFDFFRKRKTLPLILIVLLAATFQLTALIVIPIYFFTFIKLNKKTIIAYVVLVFFAFIFSKEIIYLATRFVYQSYWGSEFVEKILGGSFVTIPLVAMITCIALYPSWSKRSEFAETMLKVIIINATIWLFGSLRHMILERFCMYTYLYTIYALPDALNSLKASPEKIKERDLLEEESKKRKLSLSQQNLLNKLSDTIRDHKYYYSSAVGAIVLVTFLYLYSGMRIEPEKPGPRFYGFHGVAPYQSVIEQLHTDPPPRITKEQKPKETLVKTSN